MPNLHSAGLTVLSDVNEDRLQLPAVTPSVSKASKSGVEKGAVQVVSQLAQPFRIEDLWEDAGDSGGDAFFVLVGSDFPILPCSRMYPIASLHTRLRFLSHALYHRTEQICDYNQSYLLGIDTSANQGSNEDR